MENIYKSIKKRLIRASAVVDNEGIVIHCTEAAKEMFKSGQKLLNGSINQILEDDLTWEHLILDSSKPVVLNLNSGKSVLLHIEQLSDKVDKFFVVHFESLDQTEKLDVVFENVLDVISIKTTDGTYIDASPSVKRIKGYEPNELIGENYFNYLHPDDRDILREDISRYIQNGDTKFSHRYRFKHKNGNYIWMETIGEVFYKSSGKETTIYTLSRDITKQIEIEEQNEKIKTQFLEVFESIDEGIVYQDANGLITNANKAAQKILGLSLDQMQGRTSMHPKWKSIHEDGSDYPGETHPAVMALKTGDIIRNKIMGVFHPELNQHVWIKINSYPMFNESDANPVGVHTTFIDITTEYNYAKAVEESESKFRVLFDNAFQFIGLMKTDGTMIDANQTGLQFLGLSKEEALGAKIWETPKYSITEKVREELKKSVSKAAKGKFVRFDFKLIGPNGNSIILDFSLRPVFNEKKEVVLLIPEGRDITKRIRLQKALESEKELNELQSHFVMSASHQFRTPLTIIQSNAELLQQISQSLEKSVHEKFQVYTNRIAKQVEHTIGLMDDIMLLGKISSGVLSPSLAPFLISDLFDEINKENKNNTNGQRMTFQITGVEKSVNLDRKLLKESINNLISNALKYSNEQVTISLECNAHNFVIGIQDKGLGINKQDQKNLFQPFFRSQEVKDFNGTGLGLAIAKEYVEIQGGTISFKSSPQKGTLFNISFKYQQEA
jgi:PAS domain S-box-containing protein